MLKFKRNLIIISCLGVLMLPGAAGAASSKTETTSQSVTQGYASDSPLQNGMLVQLDSKDPKKVIPLTNNNTESLLGVVVPANDATVALSNEANVGQVFVATFGHYEALVSTQNGPIKAGDYITISALAGIGMKVDTTQPVVLGRAAASFNGSGGVASTTKLKTSSGGSVSVAIGRIPVDISISHNPLQQSVDKGVPGFLRKASQQIAGKEVGAARVYMSLAILGVTSLLAGGVLYSGIRGGLIAIGRNPLAKKSIVGGIFRVVLSGMIIFIVGLFGVYLMLRL